MADAARPSRPAARPRRGPTRRRARGAAAVAVVLAGGAVAILALAGCSDPTARATTGLSTALPAVAVDCLAPQVVAALGLGSVTDAAGTAAPHDDAPTPGRVPDGFAPMSVIVCEPGGNLLDSAGTWSSVRAVRLDGDVSRLLAALDRPVPETPTDCERSSVRRVLWLVDALGAAVLPAVAADACGALDEAVDRALAELTVSDSTSYPVRLVEPAGEPSAG